PALNGPAIRKRSDVRTCAPTSSGCVVSMVCVPRPVAVIPARASSAQAFHAIRPATLRNGQTPPDADQACIVMPNTPASVLRGAKIVAERLSAGTQPGGVASIVRPAPVAGAGRKPKLSTANAPADRDQLELSSGRRSAGRGARGRGGALGAGG